MSIALVVTRGYGNGTFSGTISLVVTRGYALGVAIGIGGPVNVARMPVTDLALANPIYAGAVVRIHGLNMDGTRNPGHLPTLYEGPTGETPAMNPQVLDADGKFRRPVYVEEPVALEIRRRYAPALDSGVRRPASPLSGAGSPEGAVAAAVGAAYLRTDGAADTTLYVKESGAGNTGWVAK